MSRGKPGSAFYAQSISSACRRYPAALVEGEATPPFANGLPEHVRLRSAALRKRLRTPFTA